MYGQFPNPRASENEFLSQAWSSNMPFNAVFGKLSAVEEKGGSISRFSFQFASKRLLSCAAYLLSNCAATSYISCVRFAYKSTKLLTSGTPGLQTKLSFIGKVLEWDSICVLIS